jgi:nitroreductase
MDLFEAMETQRAIRRLKPDPVPEELLLRLVHYATRAPSAGNAQLWRFLIVTEQADREFLGDVVRRAFEPRIAPEPAADDNSPAARGTRTFRDFALHFERVPAAVLCCCEDGYPSFEEPQRIFTWSTIYPAVQNLLLAARALELGAAFTTFQIAGEPEIKERFGIPEQVFVGAVVPVGYPEGKYGPLSRVPVEEVTYWDRWGATR